MDDTAAYFQADKGASSSIDAMPWEIMLELVKHMDSKDRSAWRLVNKAACQAVYEGTTALAPSSSAHINDISALPLPLLSKCSGLQQLSCKELKRLSSIQGRPPGLRVLDISGMSARITDMSPLGRCPDLMWLAAAGSPMASYNEMVRMRDRILVLAPAIQGLSQLQHLDLSYNYICAEGVRALGPALHQLTGLQTLDLNNNDMGAESAQALAPALQHLTGLQHLDLGRNEFWNEGARALAPALRHLTRLQRLGLSQNRLGPVGITALAPCIKELRALQSLDLDYNYGLLEAESAQALALSLRELTGLMKLDLTSCNMTPGAAQALAPAIKALPRLEVLLSDPDRALVESAVVALHVDALK